MSKNIWRISANLFKEGLMKKILYFFLVMMVVLSFGCADASKSGMFEGNTAGTFTAYDLDGKAVSLDEYLGKEPVLLVFFATWCPPCRKEVPELIKINDLYADKGLKLIATSLDNSVNVLPGFIKKNRIDYTVWHDAGKSAQQLYEIQGIPTNILIDSNGIIRSRTHHPPHSKDIESLLE
jgi:peroxiredoxin